MKAVVFVDDVKAVEVSDTLAAALDMLTSETELVSLIATLCGVALCCTALRMKKKNIRKCKSTY
jgi:hypothetical protein